jgi:4-amino-4-deoxy-L-arabinose transferase-like glycosyltransferase
LSGQEIISFDARFYLFALEMWRHGLGWFPTTYGVPYPDYPVASTLLIYASASLFGGLDKLTAVLPSAIAAALTVMMTYKIGRLENRKIGTYAVCTLLSTLTFLQSARSISLDMYPVLMTTCCFYLVHSAALQQIPCRARWVYPLFVISFIFRGPIGLVMPTGVVCVYYLLQRNIRQFLVTGLIALLLLVACTASLLLLAYHVGGSAFLQDVLRMEVLGRIGSKFLPVYFYFKDSFISYALSYPFALAVMVSVIVGVCTSKASRQDSIFLLLLTGWVLVIMVGMSVPGDKKVRYILPMAPALALLAASLWAMPPKQKFLVVMRYAAQAIFFLLPGILFAASGYVWHISTRYEWAQTLPFMNIMIFFGVMQAANIYFYMSDIHAAGRRSLWIIFSGTICFIAANLFIVEPIELQVDGTRAFVQSVEQLRLQKHARLAFYREHEDGLPIKYLVDMLAEEKPIFIADEAALQAAPAPLVIVTSDEYFYALTNGVRQHFSVITRGRIGHVNVVVLERGEK